jgi:AraC-like DNA-binding protein
LTERVQYWRPPGHPGVELLTARYRRQSFSRHTHDGYAFGVIQSGALGFHYRGENVVAPPGAINLVVPGEAHTGHPAAESGWAYRMFYFDPQVLIDAAGQMAGRPQAPPFFRAGVLFDPALARGLENLHQRIEAGTAGRLEIDSRLLGLLTGLIRRHAEARPPESQTGREPAAAARAREYIHSHADRNVSLRELAEVSFLSPFHLARVFTRQTGLPPHAYLVQVRVKNARRLMDQGLAPAEAAARTGFVDQSHLTRCFKRITGLTPGQYRKMIQDGRRGAQPYS